MDSSAVNEVRISERAQHLLKALIEQYIREGKPVGSRSLTRQAGLDLSPATVRNVMADLEGLGLVASPHTSAGRVPTARGYRFFVDTLMTLRPLPSGEVQRLKDCLNPDQTVQELLHEASFLLSSATRLASVVMWSRRRRVVLRQVEFLPLSDQRILAILVLNEREVKSTIIHTQRRLSPAELQQAANYLNQVFANQDVFSIRDALLREMQEASEHMDRIVTAAVEMAQKVFVSDAGGDDYILAGQTHLFDFADPADLVKLRQLFDAFSRKRDILNLLDESLQAGGLHVFIGEESGCHVLDEFSVVTSPYFVSGQALGVLGVIGPTRMAYERIVPIVDTAARLLGEALNQQQ